MFLTRLSRVTECQGPTPEREPEKRLPHPRKAAGAQITHFQNGEVVTKNNETVLFEVCHRNGYNLNPLTRIYWRASLVPAAAVIPAPIAYIKVVAVKKLVVELLYISGSGFGQAVTCTSACKSRLAFTGQLEE